MRVAVSLNIPDEVATDEVTILSIIKLRWMSMGKELNIMYKCKLLQIDI